MGRYGETYRDERGPDLRTLTIPSRWLQRHSIELLVWELEISEQTLESRPVQTVNTVDVLKIRVGPTVQYPVHKVLLYKDQFLRGREDEGVTIWASARMIESAGFELGKDMLIGVLNESMNFDTNSLVSMGFKTSLDNMIWMSMINGSDNFTRLRLGDRSVGKELLHWSDGGLSQVQDWLIRGTETQDSELKPAIGRSIQFLLKGVESSILREETERLDQLASNTVTEFVRQDLEEAISSWSESAHMELRNTLESASYTRTWRKLAWWKLFWRVDDIDMLTRDILERSWLVESEKGLIWIGGRIQQASLLGSTRPSTTPKPTRNKPIYGTFPESLQIADLLDSPTATTNPLVVNDENPQPQNLAIARAALSTLTIPPLQSLSQRLLLQTISTVTTTSVLSGLLYYSISTTSIYEAGSIAALGLVWSLRRLQRKWEDARKEWMGTVREEARRTLMAVEHLFRRVVWENGRPKLDPVEVDERREAREAAARVREELERVQ